ncbi:MAG: hypothetical protein AAF647_01595 [Pseudomonadota bacterium]
MPDSAVSDGGMVLSDVAALVKAWGGDVAKASAHLPTVTAGGVQSAPTGVIQDPAGTLFYSQSFSGAGAASGAIYDLFNNMSDEADHLVVPPKIANGSSIFNASTGAGGRVLHTFSPYLPAYVKTGPSDATDRSNALAAIANGYGTALLAFSDHYKALGNEGTLLNLVPISANYFAGPFGYVKPAWQGGMMDDPVKHLDPSYTFAALMLAISAALAKGAHIAPMTIYYFDRKVRADATQLAASLTS